jgi:hypothetical protein
MTSTSSISSSDRLARPPAVYRPEHLPVPPAPASPRVPHPRASKSRAALAWGVGLFFLIQLALSVACDRWLTVVRDRDHAFKTKALRAVLTEEAGRPLVLMLGSSRTMGAFHAGKLDGQPGPDGRPLASFNFGQVRTGAIRTWARWQELLDEGVRPRLLLVEVLPLLLNEAGPHRPSEEDWMGYYWPSAADLVRLWPYCEMPGKLLGGWLKARLCPCYFHRQYIMDRLAHSWEPITERLTPERWYDRHGWYLGESRRSVAPAIVRDALDRHYREFGAALKDFRLGAGPVQALHDMLERCRHEDIPVALVLMPEHSELRGWYPPEAHQAIDDLMADLSRTFAVEVIDAREWIEDDCFCDALHLVPHGALLFTRQFIPEIQRLLSGRMKDEG